MVSQDVRGVLRVATVMFVAVIALAGSGAGAAARAVPPGTSVAIVAASTDDLIAPRVPTVRPTTIGSLPWSTTRAATAPGRRTWFQWTAPFAMTVRADATASSRPHSVTVRAGRAGTFVTRSASGRVIFIATRGMRYLFEVQRASRPRGKATLTFRLARYTARPSNDDIGKAITITSLPKAVWVNNSNATLQRGEGIQCGSGTFGSYIFTERDTRASVWYSFTPTKTTVLRIDTRRTGRLVAISVTGPRPAWDALGRTMCGFDQVTFQANAGTRYRVRLATRRADRGVIRARFAAMPRPGNDDLADAIPITTLPFSDGVANEFATTQGTEPRSECSTWDPDDGVTYVGLNRTLWWRWTPDADQVVRVEDKSDHPSIVDVFEGGSLGSLVPIGCTGFASSAELSFGALAGHTYLIRTHAPVFREDGSGADWIPSGTARFELTESPAP